MQAEFLNTFEAQQAIHCAHRCQSRTLLIASPACHVSPLMAFSLFIRFYHSVWPLTFLPLMHVLGEDNCFLPPFHTALWAAGFSGQEHFSVLSCAVLKAMGTQPEFEELCYWIHTKREGANTLPLKFLLQPETPKMKPFCEQKTNSHSNCKWSK